MATRTPRTRQRARELTVEERKDRFLEELAKRANVSAAAKKAGVGRSTVYDWYRADEDFAKRWDEAVDVAVDSLEKEAWRRARDGVLKPVYQKGEKVGTVREFSDQLMITLLKAHRPDRYRDRQQLEHTGPGGQPLPPAVAQVNVYIPDNGRDRNEPEAS